MILIDTEVNVPRTAVGVHIDKKVVMKDAISLIESSLTAFSLLFQQSSDFFYFTGSASLPRT